MSNNFFNSKDEYLLLSYFLFLDKIVNRNNIFFLIKLDNNNIKQLIFIKKRLVKIFPLSIFRQSTKKGKKTQKIGLLIINYRKMIQIYAFF